MLFPLFQIIVLLSIFVKFLLSHSVVVVFWLIQRLFKIGFTLLFMDFVSYNYMLLFG